MFSLHYITIVTSSCQGPHLLVLLALMTAGTDPANHNIGRGKCNLRTWVKQRTQWVPDRRAEQPQQSCPVFAVVAQQHPPAWWYWLYQVPAACAGSLCLQHTGRVPHTPAEYQHYGVTIVRYCHHWSHVLYFPGQVSQDIFSLPVGLSKLGNITKNNNIIL